MCRKTLLNKFAYVLLMLPLLLVLSCSAGDSGSPAVTTGEPMAAGTALDYFSQQNIRVGINIGNTLDAWGGSAKGLSTETVWGNPKINQKLMDGIKTAGFDIVRIPVTWMGHIGSAPDYTIDAAFLARVAEVVDLAHNSGLKVIINLHHDGSTPGVDANGAAKDSGWLSLYQALHGHEADITAEFTAVWKQIAEKFRDYGDYLFFEAFNELHDGQWFWAARNVPVEQYDLINRWNQAFCDTVRATGGNNKIRFLVIPGYCAGPEALLNNNFVPPADSVSGRQIVAFHYYQPNNIALNGSSTIWGSAADQNSINNLFTQLKAKFILDNIPVIIGETGPVLNQSADGDATRLAYISYMFGAAKSNGLIPMYWDNGGFSRNGDGFGVFNRYNGDPESDDLGQVIQAMIDATKD